MCKVCEKWKKVAVTPAVVTLALGEIAVASKKRGAEHFKNLVDLLLETIPSEPNESLDEAWERGNRK